MMLLGISLVDLWGPDGRSVSTESGRGNVVAHFVWMHHKLEIYCSHLYLAITLSLECAQTRPKFED